MATYLTRCTNCNNLCQSCNSCRDCQTQCNTVCATAQNFPAINRVPGITFSFGACLDKGQTIKITASKWNELIEKIKSVYYAGSESNNSKSYTAPAVAKIGDGITAAEFLKVARNIDNTSNSYSAPNLAKDSIMYGTYFEDLENYASSMRYKSNQCNDCVSQCNNKCQLCNNCNAGGCQVHDPKSEEYCCSCNISCQTTCQKSCQSCNTCQTDCQVSCQSCNTCQSKCQKSAQQPFS